MENESPFAQTSDPSNGQLIFATLRDLFAELYSEENDARVVVDDAGLDAKQIAFSARAQTNWHHILIEAVRQNRLNIVLSTALNDYPNNPRLKDAYAQYTLFTQQGGEIRPPEHLAIDNPGPTVATEGGAYVARNVSIEKGDFVGRDQIVHGDKVAGDKIAVGSITGSTGVAIGTNARSTLTQQFFNIFQGTQPETRDLHNRKVMLKRVREYWIEGVLEQSLYESIRIRLGLTVKADAVVVRRPWHITIQPAQQQAQRLPQNKPIIDVFDEMEQSLLILGEPGSGKTTTLLDLARDLITRAEQNPSYPIPIVFNLSSWAVKRESIAEWLGEELKSHYGIPQKLAQTWIDNDAVLPLLDGLDEVTEAYRNECVNKINQFRQERANVLPIVVCCRVAEYTLLPTRLELQNAVFIEPLTLQQIMTYVDELGDHFRTVKQAIQQDHELQELVQTPFMLNVMTVAFGGMDSKALEAFCLAGNYQQTLFNRYIKKIFTYRGDKPSLYSHRQTISWLNWLANWLFEHRQTIFLLELIQPSWLQTNAQGLSFFLISGILNGLIAGLAIGLISGMGYGLIFGLLTGVRAGLSIGQLISLRNTAIKLQSIRSKPNEGLRQSAISSFLIGLLTGLGSGLIGGPLFGLAGGLGCALFFGGQAWIQHYILRYILYRNNYIPWNYVGFLDYCADRLFLRKVGGGYLFIHRLLMEHFAKLSSKDIERLADE